MNKLPFFESSWAFDGGTRDVRAVGNDAATACRRGGATKAGRAAAEEGKYWRPEAVAGRLDRYACEASVVHWRAAWKAPVNLHQCGVLRTYADQVEPARKGAVSHAGGRTNVVCDAEN